MEKSEYEKSYDKALGIWDNLENVNKIEPYYQTTECPMHPHHYFHLCQVRGFKEKNGDCYEDYVTIWSEMKKNETLEEKNASTNNKSGF